ncbi:FRG domain-containing protein [Modestobacter marinus]|uniref:FRG domain-containing protein n=1 Tax=Modestobacter marinus TaxID=477641 RepID=UPI001C949F04|nr:FRG domain-containing protein [Modestobacter marinus]
MDDQADPRWTTSGWGYGVKTQDQAFRAVNRIVSLAAGRRYVWRGSSDRSHRLRSSLLRDLIIDESEPLPTELELRRRELAVLREAREWGLARELGPPASDLHLLAHLQQHGVPTRLLDVTHNPMTALWLACEGGDEAGVLFAFDVTDAPTYDTVGLPSDPLDWSLRLALAVSARRAAPFLVRPTRPSARMRAQEGLFLSAAVPLGPALPGVDGVPLPTGEPPGPARLAGLFAPEERGAGRPARVPFCAVVIPARIKRKVKEHLTALNRRRSTVYPDVDGFREALRDGEVALHPLPDAVPAHEDTDATER